MLILDLFYSSSTAKSGGCELIDCSGHGIPPLLSAVLQLLPLDEYVFHPVHIMDMVNSDKKKGMKVSGDYGWEPSENGLLLYSFGGGAFESLNWCFCCTG